MSRVVSVTSAIPSHRTLEVACPPRPSIVVTEPSSLYVVIPIVISEGVCLMVTGPPAPGNPRPAAAPRPPRPDGGGSLLASSSVHVPVKSGRSCACGASGRARLRATTLRQADERRAAEVMGTARDHTDAPRRSSSRSQIFHNSERTRRRQCARRGTLAAAGTGASAELSTMRHASVSSRIFAANSVWSAWPARWATR